MAGCVQSSQGGEWQRTPGSTSLGTTTHSEGEGTHCFWKPHTSI